jgi:hypothetical protein
MTEIIMFIGSMLGGAVAYLMGYYMGKHEGQG